MVVNISDSKVETIVNLVEVTAAIRKFKKSLAILI